MQRKIKHTRLKNALLSVVNLNKAKTKIFTKEIPEEKCNFSKALVEIGHKNNFAFSLSLHGSFLNRRRKTKHVRQAYCFNYDIGCTNRWRHHLRGVFFTRLDFVTTGSGTFFFVQQPRLYRPHNLEEEKFHLSGPIGLKTYISHLCHFLLSPHQASTFLQGIDFSDDDTEYYDNAIHVRKISVQPSVSHGTLKPTASYVCRIHNFHPCSIEIETDIENGLTAETKVNQELTYSPTIVVVDSPTASHFRTLKENPIWENLKSEGALPSLVVHITPESIFYSCAYQKWKDSFGSDCKHLVVKERNDYMKYSWDECLQIYIFNKICPSIFPPVKSQFVPHVQDDDNVNFRKASPELSLDIEGSVVNWRSNFNLEKIISDADELLEYAADTTEKSKLEHVFKQQNSHRYFPRLYVLGSGGTTKALWRSNPGFLLRLNEASSILLDCGQGTLESIYFQFGNETNNFLSSLKLIFISHIHLDHHSSFIDILEKLTEVKTNNKETANKTYCMMPEKMCSDYAPVMEHLLDDANAILVPVKRRKYSMVDPDIVNYLGLKSLIAVKVIHSVLTFGVSLVTDCGKKIVYSSDTLPMCRDLINYGKNADLLIHDCLYVHEDLLVQANSRMHSTLIGALETSKAMNAKFTLLTHFTTRLPVQPVSEFPEEYKEKVGVAYDNLSISIDDLHKYPLLRPVINTVFRDIIYRANVREEKRKMKHERKNAIFENLAEIL